MLYILFLLIIGLIIGSIAKLLHPGKDPAGCLSTIGIGIAGSYVGGFLSWIIFGGTPLRMSGLIFGVIGGVIFLIFWRWCLKKFWIGKINDK